MRIPEIQGLRALAVILVIAFHAKFISGGFIGVDIFYVISGYLITGLVVKELRATGGVSLSKFYARRIKRLLPSSFLVLLITALVSLAVMPPGARMDLGRNIIATSLYVSNYLLAWWQNDYQNLGATPSPLVHFWSLAVEEQFYLFWPLVILLFGRGIRIGRVIKALSAITFFSFLLSLIATMKWPIWSFYSLPTRAWELGAGALLVFYRPKRVSHKWSAWVALALILITAAKYNDGTAFPGTAALVPIISAAFLIFKIEQLPTPLSQFFRTRFVQWVGNISYPLYLWHWPLLILPVFITNRPLSIAQRLLCVMATFLLAGLTHKFVEEPLRHAKAPLRKVGLVALTATLALTLLGVGVYLSSSQKIENSGISGTADLKQIKRTPIIYGDGCQVGKTSTQSPPCEYGDLRGSKTIVLFGDSHAAQWFPTLEAIAKKNAMRLIVLTKSSCPAASLTLDDQGAFRNAPCEAWRENSFERITRLRPWAVFSSNFDHYSAPRHISDRTTWWRNGISITENKLRTLTAHSILMKDTPWPNRDIPSCLSQKSSDKCVTTRPHFTPLKNLPTSTLVLDPTHWFCDQSCPAIRDGIVVYRDSTHMSVDFALHLQPVLAQLLKSDGVIGSPR